MELMERVSFEASRNLDSDEDELFNDGGGNGNQVFALPPPIQGKHQLQAMLRRQWLFKKRGWGQTLMELISPLLMMSLVVWGWWRSTEVHYGLEFPVNSTIPLFKALKNEYGTAQSLLQICPPDRLLAQNISPEELALLSTLIREDVLRGLDGLQALNSTANMTLGDALINGQRLIGSIPMSPALLSLAMKCIGSESQLATAFDAFNEYHGSLPIPSLDAFVGLGKLIRQAIGICFL